MLINNIILKKIISLIKYNMNNHIKYLNLPLNYNNNQLKSKIISIIDDIKNSNVSKDNKLLFTNILYDIYKNNKNNNQYNDDKYIRNNKNNNQYFEIVNNDNGNNNDKNNKYDKVNNEINMINKFNDDIFSHINKKLLMKIDNDDLKNEHNFYSYNSSQKQIFNPDKSVDYYLDEKIINNDKTYVNNKSFKKLPNGSTINLNNKLK